MGSEAERLRAAQAGSLAAFNTLVADYQRQVYNLCYRTLGHAEDAADATQDVFLHAYRALAGFRGEPEGFRGWLLRIAVNACYDLVRRRKRRPGESLEALAEARQDQHAARDLLAEPGAGPESQALSAETARRIEAGLRTLGRDQRLAVVLCDVQGLSYQEAASAMGIELGTVKSRLSRARAQLRDYLLAHGELPASAPRLDR